MGKISKPRPKTIGKHRFELTVYGGQFWGVDDWDELEVHVEVASRRFFEFVIDSSTLATLDTAAKRVVWLRGAKVRKPTVFKVGCQPIRCEVVEGKRVAHVGYWDKPASIWGPARFHPGITFTAKEYAEALEWLQRATAWAIYKAGEVTAKNKARNKREKAKAVQKKQELRAMREAFNDAA